MSLAGRSIAALILAVTMDACRTSEVVPHDRERAGEEVQRLVGVWDISLVAGGWMARRASGPVDIVSGTIAFTEAQHAPPQTSELPVVTNVGVYDLDFTPFGWATPSTGASAVAHARVTASNAGAAGSTDSVHVVLSPGADRFAVRMAGVLQGDSVAGVWTATAFSAGGGAGTFVLRRHPRS